jgi:hypothetical protein
MIATLQFATLVITTMFAAAAAIGLHWLCLEAAFLMMRSATAPKDSSAHGVGPRDGAAGACLFGAALK